jgi:hypothetical protein
VQVTQGLVIILVAGTTFLLARRQSKRVDANRSRRGGKAASVTVEVEGSAR